MSFTTLHVNFGISYNIEAKVSCSIKSNGRPCVIGHTFCSLYRVHLVALNIYQKTKLIIRYLEITQVNIYM